MDMATDTSAILETPYGKVRATLQASDVVYVATDPRNGKGYVGDGVDGHDAGLMIRGRRAYFTGHYHWVTPPPHIDEPPGWSNRWRMENGHTTYAHFDAPKWCEDSTGRPLAMAQEVTGPAAVAKVDAAIAAAVTAWATPEKRAAAAYAKRAEHIAAVKATAERYRAVAAALAAYEAPDDVDEDVPSDLRYPRELVAIERALGL
jgi:hypothetical protein